MHSLVCFLRNLHVPHEEPVPVSPKLFYFLFFIEIQNFSMNDLIILFNI
jgi:hypothetical protein